CAASAEAAPGQLNYGSAGVGSNLHLAMELLKYRTGIQVTHVPYKGVGPALQDTLAGHVMSMMSNAASAKTHVDAGALRARAVTSRGRLAAMADVPSVAEAGVPNYEVLSWFAMFAPSATPERIVAPLQREIAALLTMRETRARLTGEGAEPVASKPAEFAEF